MVSRIALITFAMALGCGAVQAETVTFPGDGVTLQGELFVPAGAGPHPAVVALHGCGGLRRRDGALSARHADWAKRLVDLDYVVLFPDSFASRGVGPQCRTSDRSTRPSRERVADAGAARRYLQGRADVKGGAVSLLGWSNGGSTVLYTVATRNTPHDGAPDFRNAVAFYPGCRVPLERGTWHARFPLMVLIGAADDWTPAAPCESLASAAAASGEPVSIKVYPGAYHDFDHPDLPIHTVGGLAYTADGNGSAHTGTDPAARADAITRATAFLSR